MVSPLKASMTKSNGSAPKGVQSGSTPKVMKGERAAGAMYKTPSIGALRGKNATDKSSGQSNPTKQSTSDKDRYKGKTQPIAYSNGGTPAYTKFVC